MLCGSCGEFCKDHAPKKSKRLALLLLSLVFLRFTYWLLFREGERYEMGKSDGHFTYKGRCYVK